MWCIAVWDLWWQYNLMPLSHRQQAWLVCSQEENEWMWGEFYLAAENLLHASTLFIILFEAFGIWRQKGSGGLLLCWCFYLYYLFTIYDNLICLILRVKEVHLVSECLRLLKWEKEKQAEESMSWLWELWEYLLGRNERPDSVLYILAAVLILWCYSAWKSRERDENIRVNLKNRLLWGQIFFFCNLNL